MQKISSGLTLLITIYFLTELPVYVNPLKASACELLTGVATGESQGGSFVNNSSNSFVSSALFNCGTYGGGSSLLYNLVQFISENHGCA